MTRDENDPEAMCSGDETLPWVKVGDTLNAGEFWYSDREAWARWHNLIAEEIEERGAWFLVGGNPADDLLVIDVIHPDRLRQTLVDNNIRYVEFWRGQS